MDESDEERTRKIRFDDILTHSANRELCNENIRDASQGEPFNGLFQNSAIHQPANQSSPQTHPTERVVETLTGNTKRRARLLHQTDS